MKRIYQILSMVSLIVAFVLAPHIACAQAPADPAIKEVALQDSLFWKGYNSCDLVLQGSLIADDIEFYHDKGGITLGKAAMLNSLKNLCKPGYKIRRAAINATIEIHVLKNNEVVYGAIITGTHQFYLKLGDKHEQLDGEAPFANLWLLKDGKWKLSRVFSFNHHPANMK